MPELLKSTEEFMNNYTRSVMNRKIKEEMIKGRITAANHLLNEYEKYKKEGTSDEELQELRDSYMLYTPEDYDKEKKKIEEMYSNKIFDSSALESAVLSLNMHNQERKEYQVLETLEKFITEPEINIKKNCDEIREYFEKDNQDIYELIDKLGDLEEKIIMKMDNDVVLEKEYIEAAMLRNARIIKNNISKKNVEASNYRNIRMSRIRKSLRYDDNNKNLRTFIYEKLYDKKDTPVHGLKNAIENGFLPKWFVDDDEDSASYVKLKEYINKLSKGKSSEIININIKDIRENIGEKRLYYVLSKARNAGLIHRTEGKRGNYFVKITSRDEKDKSKEITSHLIHLRDSFIITCAELFRQRDIYSKEELEKMSPDNPFNKLNLLYFNVHNKMENYRNISFPEIKKIIRKLDKKVLPRLARLVKKANDKNIEQILLKAEKLTNL